MQNHIQKLKINHFKSIKAVELDCKRINVFVGRPNVGKSNILEAISLLGLNSQSAELGGGMLRFEKVSNLFFDQDTKKRIEVRTDKYISLLTSSPTKDNFYQFISSLPIPISTLNAVEQLSDAGHNSAFNTLIGQTNNRGIVMAFNKEGGDGIQHGIPDKTNTKYYKYRRFERNINREYDFLAFPDGENLFQIVAGNRTLSKEIGSLFQEYGLELVFDIENERFEVQKRVDHYVFKTPFSLIADTLQRIIFYLTAIESNKNSTLLFEEPETHSFPPYITMLAEKMVASENNQFFIATHSPYLLTSLMTSGGFDNVNVVITDLVDHETKLHCLTKKEMAEMLDNGVDIFYNLNWFSKNG